MTLAAYFNAPGGASNALAASHAVKPARPGLYVGPYMLAKGDAGLFE